MRKEMPVIPVNKVVDPKRIIGKKEGWGGGDAQGVADPPPPKKKKVEGSVEPEQDVSTP
jgi:hypothetical protein